MKLIVGLGNPGPRYRNTRHNVGFQVLDLLAERWGVAFDREKYQGLVASARHGGENLILLKPLTYMNRSGLSVAEVTRNKVPDLADMLVVVDDINLPFGRLRMRERGSAGGHNGLKSIIEHVGAQDFPRLRIGVGENKAGQALTDHVLGTFKPEERAELDSVIARAAEGVIAYVEEGVNSAMNAINRKSDLER
ncbi:MAG: aminoacyl-tRNA hydrolase [Candidatus Hydrogenedentes bacterium]|nr:aminoacyl-tRNA hydrolase [Candidatus Hydrogenedentota bacterium]